VRGRELYRPVPTTSPALAVAAAVLAPAAATVLSLPLGTEGLAGAASIELLGVVVAAATGGLRAGLAGAVLSSLALNYFFTPPRYTLLVERAGDVVSLVVFVLVAGVVGLLVARAVEERDRAARREQDARLLGYLATKLLSGEPLELILHDLAEALLDPFGLARCEIRATSADGAVHVSADRSGLVPGPTEEFPIAIGGVSIGSIGAARPEGARPLSATDRQLLEAAAKQAAFALERARLDARARGAQVEAEASELRAALFSSVTHDLRTPLASIKAGVTSLLDEGAVHEPAQERELLMTILEETDRLNRLVGNLMDLARIRSGTLVPAREPTALDEVIAAVIGRMRSHLEGFEVRMKVRPDLPEVFADPVQIDQVLTNLLENAAHHAPRGSELVVSAAPFRAVVQTKVVDHGPGIPEEQRDRVFQPFYRGDVQPERPGAGLGLAIARAIVVAHEGRIWIEGVPGGGTAVVFELPVWSQA
jgi:two-component system sensor histidine kinase KdpD